jgi:TonB family protein
MAFAWVAVTCLLLVGAGATGLLLRHRGAAQRAAATEPASATEESLAQSAGNTPATAQIESNSTSAASAVPFDAKTENFPGGQSQGFADNARASQPSAKMLNLGKILTAKPLAAPVVARRSATALGRDVPPNLTGVNSNPGAAANRGILSAFLPAGGRVKEPHLVLSSVPNYPVLAKRAGIEGEVTVAAVIDINGKLTSMIVVSGSPLLQQAALDSLRTWKYEPAYLNDKPVPVQTSVTVKFRLH